jgi:hypothetical protein
VSITKSAFSDCVTICAEDLNPLRSGEVIEVVIMEDSNVLEVFSEMTPSANLLRVGSFDHGSFCG